MYRPRVPFGLFVVRPRPYLGVSQHEGCLLLLGGGPYNKDSAHLGVYVGSPYMYGSYHS